MPAYSDSFSLPSPSRESSSWLFAGFLVIALHAALLGIGVFWNPTTPPPKMRAKVIVQTVRLAPTPATIEVQHHHPVPQATVMQQPLITAAQEEPSAPVLIPPTQVESPPLPKPQIQATPAKPSTPEVKKQTVEKKAVVKKPVEKAPKIEAKPKTEKKEHAKPKPSTTESEKKNTTAQQEMEKKQQQEVAATQETVKQKQQAQLAKAKENMSKLSESRGKVNSSASTSLNLTTTSLPQEVKSLQIDSLPSGGVVGSFTGESGGKEGGVREINYRDKIAVHLKKALKLPEYGEVTVKLTLDRSGKVVKVDSVKSESAKNKAFIERTLPTLVLPSFGKEFAGLSQQTFLITLENDS